MLKTTALLLEELKNYANGPNKIKRMADSGELIPITKGLYETDKTVPGYYLAASIYGPSYLSFDFALSYYGLIPEAVYNFTSATFGKRKQKEFTNYFGTFTYRDIPKAVYPYGILLKEEKGYCYQIATPEKALCDKLYTVEPLYTLKALKAFLFEDLRIDEKEFAQLNKKDIFELAKIYGSTNIKLLAKYLGEKNE